jgi:Bacterial SH3 domain.
LQPEIFDDVLITNSPNTDDDPPDTVLSIPVEQIPVKRKRRVFRKISAFVLVIGLFAGILFGTHAYLRNSGVLPGITNPFRTQTATAKVDVYLRPTPNTNNDPIGLVTKNSKVRIVKAQNNWYEVDIIEQGSIKNDQLPATHGWLNGKFLDID